MKQLDRENLVNAVKEASEKWKSAFNTQDAEGCADCYEADALMSAKPFGEFKGRAEILAFWQNLIADGFNDVEYINPKIHNIQDNSAELTAHWRMNNAQGVIHKEIWGLQEDGSMKLREDYFEVTA